MLIPGTRFTEQSLVGCVGGIPYDRPRTLALLPNLIEALRIGSKGQRHLISVYRQTDGRQTVRYSIIRTPVQYWYQV